MSTFGDTAESACLPGQSAGIGWISSQTTNALAVAWKRTEYIFNEEKFMYTSSSSEEGTIRL